MEESLEVSLAVLMDAFTTVQTNKNICNNLTIL